MPQIVWSTAVRSRVVGLAATLLGAAGISGVFFGSQPAAMKVAIAGFVLLALWRIGDALVVLAALAPVGGALSALSGSNESWTTTLALALVAGAGLRAIVIPRATEDRPATNVAAAWILLVIASAAAECWLRASLDITPGATLQALLRWLLYQYPAVKPSYAFAQAAIMTATTATVFAIAVNACRRDSGLPARIARGLVIGSAALGVFAVYRLVEVSLRRPPFFESLLTLTRSLRVSPIIADVNAVSALLLLVIPVAAALLWTRASRWTAAIALPWLLVGLWMAGSRVALALLPVAFIIEAWPWLTRRSRAVRGAVLGLALLAAAGSAALFFLSRSRAYGSVDGAVDIRADMAATTLRMASAHPAFGIGIGNFYTRSIDFMPSQLSRGRVRRDAHNQYLQVLGELGLTGLFGFCALLWVALSPGLKALASGRASPELSGYVAGCLAFMMVSIGQHPLLIAEASLTFFLLLAVARADGVSGVGGAPAAGWPWTQVLVAAAVLACLAVPWRAARLAEATDLEGVSHGLSKWNRAEGRLWRTSRLPAVFFVSSSARRITLPLRLRAPRGAGAVAIQIRIDDRLVMALQLANEKWMQTTVSVPAGLKAGRFVRLDFRWAGAIPPKGTHVDIGMAQVESGP